MKTLLLVRHAKSSRSDPTLMDHDRPLNERGHREAPCIGTHLVETASVPDWIVSSTALRARETAQLVAAACGYDSDIDLRRELYLAAPSRIVQVLRSLPANPERVLLVAHNPGLEDYVAQLTDERHTLATSAVVSVRLGLDDWRELTPGTTGRLTSIWRPRDEE